MSRGMWCSLSPIGTLSKVECKLLQITYTLSFLYFKYQSEIHETNRFWRPRSCSFCQYIIPLHAHGSLADAGAPLQYYSLARSFFSAPTAVSASLRSLMDVTVLYRITQFTPSMTSFLKQYLYLTKHTVESLLPPPLMKTPNSSSMCPRKAKQTTILGQHQNSASAKI